MYFTDKHGISRGLQEVFHGTSPWMCCQFGTFLEVLSSAFLIRLCRRTIPTTSRIRCFDKTRHLTNTMSYRVNIGFWHVLRLSEADRDYDPVKDTGWQNSTNQNRFGRTLPLISWRWTTKKLHSQYATISHVEEFRKKLSKCHPNVLVDGHISCEVYKRNSAPNSSKDSRKRIQHWRVRW